MKIEEAIMTAKKRHRDSVLKKNQGQYNRPVTVAGLCRFFNFKFDQYEYGAPPLMLKADIQKVSGFIKVLRNNHYTDSDIYDLIEKYIRSFREIQRQELFTGKGKKYEVGPRPNIKDLLYCRDSIINIVNKEVGVIEQDTVVDWSKEDMGAAINDLEKW